MNYAAQGVRFRVPGLPGCTINGRPHVTRPALQAVVEFENQTPTKWEAREIRVRVRVQLGLPLQRGRYRDST